MCISAIILPLTEFSTGAGPILQMQVISSPRYTEVGITEAKRKHSRDTGWLSFPVSLFPNSCQIYSVLRLNCGAGSDKMNCKKTRQEAECFVIHNYKGLQDNTPDKQNTGEQSPWTCLDAQVQRWSRDDGEKPPSPWRQRRE